MRIACLAWGSLLWKTGPLRLASGWKDDGPLLPIEFARVGDKGELSTVLLEGAAPQKTWWALLEDDDLAAARESLRQREEIDPAHPEWVGSLPLVAASSHPFAPSIAEWLGRQRHRLDAVVWTALQPRHADAEGRVPSLDEAIQYLDGLRGETREHAEDYIRQVPPSLATAYRQGIEARLGWTPRGGRQDETDL
jgi:hypothetical protein